MADNSSLPVAVGNETFANKDLAGVKYPKNILFDTAGAEVAGLVTASPAANTILGRLKDLLSLIVLAAGSNIIGKVGIDQTTDGTTNAVHLVAGTAIAGKVGIDQTTDGTTNKVAADVRLAGVAADKGVGTGGSATQRVIIDSSQNNGNGQTTMTGSTPVTIASDQSAVKVTPGVSATTNGATASRVNATASNNLTSLKGSAGQLYTIDVFNVAAYNVFLKIYNKASAPVVASDTPIMTIPIQAGGGYSKTWPMGLPFATGIAYAIVKLQADTDNTNVVAGDLTGNIVWI